MRVAQPVTASRDEIRRLQEWARGTISNPRVLRRAKIVLRAVEGDTNREIGRKEQVTERTVRLWRERFAKGGLAALYLEAPRVGRPRRFASAEEAAIVDRLGEARALGASFRTAAQLLGIPTTSAWRIHRRGSHFGGRPARPVFRYLARILSVSERQVARSYGRGSLSMSFSSQAQRRRARAKSRGPFPRVPRLGNSKRGRTLPLN